MVFLGYMEGTKAYWLYDPHEDKVLVLRDVVFDEKAAWDWTSSSMGEAGGFTSTFVDEHLVIHGGGDAREEVPSTPAGKGGPRRRRVCGRLYYHQRPHGGRQQL